MLLHICMKLFWITFARALRWTQLKYQSVRNAEHLMFGFQQRYQLHFYKQSLSLHPNILPSLFILTVSLPHRPAASCTLWSLPPVSLWCWAGARTLLCSAGCQCGSEWVPPAASGWLCCTSPPPCCNASQCHAGWPLGMLSVKRWRKAWLCNWLMQLRNGMFFCWELDEKSDTSHVCMINMKFQPAAA